MKKDVIVIVFKKSPKKIAVFYKCIEKNLVNYQSAMLWKS